MGTHVATIASGGFMHRDLKLSNVIIERGSGDLLRDGPVGVFPSALVRDGSAGAMTGAHSSSASDAIALLLCLREHRCEFAYETLRQAGFTALNDLLVLTRKDLPWVDELLASFLPLHRHKLLEVASKLIARELGGKEGVSQWWWGSSR